MKDYIQTSTYEYILTYFLNNQITDPTVIYSTVYDRAKIDENTQCIYPIYKDKENEDDENQSHLDYTYYTHIAEYDKDSNTYSYNPLQNPTKDIISCAYSFTNITKYYDEDHNEFTSQAIHSIDTDGTIHIQDAGIAQIKTDFYESSYYFLDSTYYLLKVLYPTILSLNYADYFASDPNIISEVDHNTREDILENQIDQLIDCTEKFDSEHNVIQNNVFVRFPNKDFINYKVPGINYNPSFSPNFIYEWQPSPDLSRESLNIFNELTGTLSIKSEYINNNSYVDLKCRVLYERDNFFSPYYFEHNNEQNNPILINSSEIIFRHYFKKLLPMKYELEDNTYIVYLNEAIENSLKNTDNSELSNKYGPTPITFDLSKSISASNIKIQDTTNKQTVGFALSGTTLSFEGTFGHEYTFSIAGSGYIVGNVYDSSSDAAISKDTFKFIISRNTNKAKSIIVQSQFVGIQNPSIDPNITDNSFRQWIDEITANGTKISIQGINVKIGSPNLPSDDPDYVPATIEKKSLEITFAEDPKTTYNVGRSASLQSFNPYSIKIAGTTTLVNLSLKWRSSDTNIASISGDTIYLHKEGIVKIIANVESNSSYHSTSKSYALIIKKSGGPIVIDEESIIVHFANSSVSVQASINDEINIQSVTVSPSNYRSKGYTLQYTSSNTDIASITGSNKIKIYKEGSVVITCSLKNGSTTLASDRYTLNIGIISANLAVSFELSSDLYKGQTYAGLSDDEAWFYPTKICLRKRDNGGIIYETTIQSSSGSGVNNRVSLGNTNKTTMLSYKYGDGLMDKLGWGQHEYFRDKGFGQTVIIVTGYIGNNTSTKKDFEARLISYDYSEVINEYQTIPWVRFRICVFNQIPYTSTPVYKSQNPFGGDNDLTIDELNQAYSQENRLISNDIIYGADIDETISADSIDIEEYGLTQIEEMPELYLPKNLDNESYKKLKYSSSNTDVAEIIYWDYDPEYGTEVFMGYDADPLSAIHRLKPKLLIHRDGESIISVEYTGDDVYGKTMDVSFKLIVKLKGTPQLSLDQDKFEIERQLASAIDESIDNEDPISGFQIFQSPTPNVVAEETIPIAFEYFSSNDVIGTPYGDLGDILIFDVGTIKVTIKLKETKKYHSTTISYQLIIKNPPDKTETILNVEQAYYQIRYTQYVDKKIYRVYDAVNGSRKHLVFETNLYSDITKIQENNNISELPQTADNIREYLIDNIKYEFYYKNSDTPCTIYNNDNEPISFIDNYYDFENIGQYGWLFDKLNGTNIPLFDYENIEYSDNFTKAKVRLNCYDVLDESGNHGYYIYSRGLANRLKTDANNFIKGSILGTYIDKHLKILIQKDSLGIYDTTFPTYSENFVTYGMQMVNVENPKESKAFRHAFSTDMNEYVNSTGDDHVNISFVNGGCAFYVKQSKISKDDYNWKKELMFLNDYDDEELNHQIFKSKYTSNNTDEDVEYIFTSSVPEIAKTNSNGDVIIYNSGKVKIMIRSTETENFTSGETGYVLDILPKERPMLESKYTRYLHEMDTTLVENVFGCPDFDWNNSDPDAKLLFWIRNGGPADNKDSYLTLDDISGLKLDEDNPDDEDWEHTSSEASQYFIAVAQPGSTTFTTLGKASEIFYQACRNESNITNLEINDTDHTIYLKNCTYKFYSKSGTLITNDKVNLYNLLFNSNFLNINNNPDFISTQFGWDYSIDIFKSILTKNGLVNDSNVITNVDGDFTIRFDFNVIPVFNSTEDNLVYFLGEMVNDQDGESPRVYHGWYYIDPVYVPDQNNSNIYRIYSDQYRKRYVIAKNQNGDEETRTTVDLSTAEYQSLVILFNDLIKTNNPVAFLDGATERNHIYITGHNSDEDEDYSASNNIYSSPSIVDDTNDIIYSDGDIIYGAASVSKEDFTNELDIIKNITYRYIGPDGKVVYTKKDGTPIAEGEDPVTETRKFKVTVDEAGNVSIENGLMGHVINVLVKSIETDNFKPTYLVYNIVIKSILDRVNGDGTEDGNGYAVETSKKNNSITIDEKLLEVKTNPNDPVAKTNQSYPLAANNKPKIVSTPVFSCSSNDPDLQVEYYIYDGGEINGNEWYASHYFKEFRRAWHLSPSSEPAQQIVELITGKTYKRTINNEICTITVKDRYSKSIQFDGAEYQNKTLAEIDNNGNLKISSLLHDRVINVMIYFSGTSDYYDNCVFYNVKVLKKNETILTLPQNIFSVSQPYPYSGIFQLPEIRTNNTDTDEIKYYITARHAGRVLHDTNSLVEYLDDHNNNLSFGNTNGDGLYWEYNYGHYADNLQGEKNYTTNIYSPTNIIANNYDETININYPTAINGTVNGENVTLFSIYRNGQIKYTNKAGRYVLNVAVISAETTNFLQGYGFYNLEVEIKDEPTLGIYPPYIEVRVGTDDVHIKAPDIICSNNDSNATLSFEIHDYVTSGGSQVDPSYSPNVYNGSDITVDQVGNITIKGGLFNNSSYKEKKWWIKVISNPSPNFGSVWKKFLVHAIEKKIQSISCCPSTILLRPSNVDRTIKSDIKYSNTDEDCILTYTSSNPGNVSIDSFGVMTVYANRTGNTNITITSPETENYKASNYGGTTYQFTVSVVEKTTPTLYLDGGKSSIDLTRTVVVGSEVFAGPAIEHNNTDPGVKPIYISSNTSLFTVTPKGALVVYKTGSNGTLTVKLPETENFKAVAKSITINITQQTI